MTFSELRKRVIQIFPLGLNTHRILILYTLTSCEPLYELLPSHKEAEHNPDVSVTSGGVPCPGPFLTSLALFFFFFTKELTQNQEFFSPILSLLCFKLSKEHLENLYAILF